MRILVEDIKLTISILTLLSLAAGFFFALYRFGIKREKHCFLNITLDKQVICKKNNLLLVSIKIGLANKGETRIFPRTKYQKKSEFLFEDKFDKCMYSGTLKIRRVPINNEQLISNWYSLKPIDSINSLQDENENRSFNLEQINYLDEYLDTRSNFKKLHFWIEPKEEHTFDIPIWLEPGIYAVKAFFLGKRIKYRNEEYWSRTTFINISID
jgi:hypothetical protein